MMGMIGQSFIGQRIFEVLLKDGSNSIELTDYVSYYDVIYHGIQSEKNLISFKMLDLSRSGRITFDTYEQFWKQFLLMYGELMNLKIEYNQQMHQATQQAFSVIADGTTSFDFKMFERTRESNPELLEWIEEPESFIKNQIEGQPQHIQFEAFQKYHEEVLSEF